MKPIISTIDNKVKAKWNQLFKAGYYLRPCVYENTTNFEIAKDLHPVNCNASRSVYGIVNSNTAKLLSQFFGFRFSKPTEYNGKGDTVGNWKLLQHYY